MTMNEWNKAHQMGDVVVVDELIKEQGMNEELDKLQDDCWEHEFFVEGGESYDSFKDRFIEITSKYVIDWDEEEIEE